MKNYGKSNGGKSMSKASTKASEKPRMTSGNIAKGDSRSKTMNAPIKPSKGC